MDKIYVHGRIPLQGRITVQGSKNAALPILAATLLTQETCVIHNCPKISDAQQMLMLLRQLGCMVRWEQDGVKVDGRASIGEASLLYTEATKMRSSVFFLGALLGSCKCVELPYPGGCVIGQRPIDIHIKALEQLNVEFVCKEDRLIAQTNGVTGGEVRLPFPSVGATENLMMAATLARGKTRIEGAAREPEIVSLGRFLIAMGAEIKGLGESTLEIEGVKELHGVHFRIPSDRIVAGTYMMACMGTGGDILLADVPTEDMESVLSVIDAMGGNLQVEPNQIYLQAPARLKAIPFLQTRVHPGFPTDLQSPLLACLCLAEGNSVIQEDIFEQRFHVVSELVKMGANIEFLSSNQVRIGGVETLYGNEVTAKELRGGAALVVAALCAKGKTCISGREFIDRGYANICKDLRDLGARIYSV